MQFGIKNYMNLFYQFKKQKNKHEKNHQYRQLILNYFFGLRRPTENTIPENRQHPAGCELLSDRVCAGFPVANKGADHSRRCYTEPNQSGG